MLCRLQKEIKASRIKASTANATFSFRSDYVFDLARASLLITFQMFFSQFHINISAVVRADRAQETALARWQAAHAMH